MVIGGLTIEIGLAMGLMKEIINLQGGLRLLVLQIN
jgi:hypothetical protein